MRKILSLTAGLIVWGCAVDPSVYREANLDCQAVGISESDPQFATCSKAYAEQHLEDQLEKSYRGAQKRVLTETERRIPHQDVY
ncbi:MAG TPA: hypothetical protein VHT51_13420 [Micropepsaceae bacterium]|nr:hypothetical protein [Micropepsaceae bacterium]